MSFIHYLRRQQKVVKDINAEAPNVAENRWEVVDIISGWFRKHQADILAHLDVKRTTVAPTPS